MGITSTQEKHRRQVMAALLSIEVEDGNGFTASMGKILERLPKDGPSEPSLKTALGALESDGSIRVEITGAKKPRIYHILRRDGQVSGGLLMGTQTTFPEVTAGTDSFDGFLASIRQVRAVMQERRKLMAEAEARKAKIAAELDEQIAQLREANEADDRRLREIGGQLLEQGVEAIAVEADPVDPEGGQESPEDPGNGPGGQKVPEGGPDGQEGDQSGSEATPAPARTALRTARAKAAAAQAATAAA